MVGLLRTLVPTVALSPAFVIVAQLGSPAVAQVVEVESLEEVFKERAEGRQRAEGRRLPSPQDQVYTWADGDRTRRAYLQEDLIVTTEGAIAASGVEVAKTSGGSIVRVAEASRAEGLPVFRSLSGSLMTLPGGILLVFVPAWGESQIEAFFATNDIAMDRVSPLGELPNGFVVETEPGFPSLELAKALAGLDGVRLSSPNWWRERTTR